MAWKADTTLITAGSTAGAGMAWKAVTATSIEGTSVLSTGPVTDGY